MKIINKIYISLIVIGIAFMGFIGSAEAITLSQTSISMTVGQTYVVTASNLYTYYNSYGTIYISSNSNSNIATASVVGSNISIFANNTGSTNITVCQNNSGSTCASIYVSVSGTYYNNNTYYNPVSSTPGLSISNLVFAVGSNVTLSSPNYSGLYVSNNSNPNIASAINASTTSGGGIGCAAGAQYSNLTGQPCFGQVGNGGYSSIPGCYAGAQYSTFTGQPCFNNYNNNQYNYNYPNTGNNNSVEILGVSSGTDAITLCQSNNGSACTTVNVTVY